MRPFRNASVYILAKNQEHRVAGSSLASFVWTPSDIFSDFSLGFLPLSDDKIINNSNGILNGVIRIEKKIPPRSLVNDLVIKKASEIRLSGRSVSRDERSAIRDDIVKSLIPKTLPGYSNIQFIICTSKSKNGEGRDNAEYLVFDRAIGSEIDACIGLLESSGILNCHYRAMIPHKFYDNLTENLLKGRSFYDNFEINDVFEVFSQEVGLYEFKRPSSGVDLGENERVDSISVSTKVISFTIKSNGILKKIKFTNHNFGFEHQTDVLCDIISKLEKET